MPCLNGDHYIGIEGAMEQECKPYEGSPDFLSHSRLRTICFAQRLSSHDSILHYRVYDIVEDGGVT